MSENEDLQREGLNVVNGKQFYRDKLGNWFQKSGDYESIFAGDIIDDAFRAEVLNEIQGSNDEKISLQYENRWYTIWQNMEDGMRSNINRKKMHNKTDANNTYDSTQQSKDDIPKSSSNTGSKFSYSKSGGTDGKKAFYYKGHDFIKLTEWKDLNKGNYNIKILPPTQMDPNNYLIKNQETGEAEMWVWIAEKVEMG